MHWIKPLTHWVCSAAVIIYLVYAAKSCLLFWWKCKQEQKLIAEKNKQETDMFDKRLPVEKEMQATRNHQEMEMAKAKYEHEVQLETIRSSSATLQPPVTPEPSATPAPASPAVQP